MKNSIAGNITDMRFQGFFDFGASRANVFTPMLGETVVTPVLFAESGDPHCKQKTESLLRI
jgi:hypothetical protein